MSWNHQTVGWSRYEAFVSALNVVGISHDEELSNEGASRGFDLNDDHQKFRVARFLVKGKCMVVEEYLEVDDHDCDGMSVVGIAVYEYGQRPRLAAEVIEA